MFKLIELLALLDMLPSYTANTTDHPHGLLTLNTPTTVAIAERAACSCDRFLMLSPPIELHCSLKEAKAGFQEEPKPSHRHCLAEHLPIARQQSCIPKEQAAQPTSLDRGPHSRCTSRDMRWRSHSGHRWCEGGLCNCSPLVTQGLESCIGHHELLLQPVEAIISRSAAKGSRL